jgi:hypothetical protein
MAGAAVVAADGATYGDGEDSAAAMVTLGTAGAASPRTPVAGAGVAGRSATTGRSPRLSGAVRIPRARDSDDEGEAWTADTRGTVTGTSAGGTADRPWRQDPEFLRVVTPQRQNPELYASRVRGTF